MLRLLEPLRIFSRLSAASLLSCLAAAFPAAGQSPDLALAEVQYRVLDDEQRFDGVVEAVHRSTISAQTSGEIIELPFDVNDFVPQGAVVIRFDDTKQKARLDKAIAKEAQAQARLGEAQARHQRNQRLIKENAVSKSQLEKSDADLKSARAALNLSRAALEEAREQWEYTVVRAPYPGILVERFVELGEHAQVGTPLGTGLSLEKLRVEVPVPALYVASIRESQKGRIRIPGPDGAWLDAGKITIFPFADEQSHTFTIRAELPAGQHGLYPGMLVKVAFTIGTKQSLVIPSQAIVHRSEVTGIYVVGTDLKVRFRQIRAGPDVPGGLSVVLAGVQAGEQVALDPVAAAIYLKQQLAVPGHE